MLEQGTGLELHFDGEEYYQEDKRESLARMIVRLEEEQPNKVVGRYEDAGLGGWDESGFPGL